MPAKPSLSASDRISNSFKSLASSATQLNAASDELSKAIAPIDAALKALNVGVSVWHRYSFFEDPYGYYSGRSIGYAKVGNKWGLALSSFSGHAEYGPDDEQEWLFNDAPRLMRLDAVDHIPALLDALVTEVGKKTSELRQKSLQARELADLISGVAAEVTGSKQ